MNKKIFLLIIVCLLSLSFVSCYEKVYDSENRVVSIYDNSVLVSEFKLLENTEHCGGDIECYAVIEANILSSKKNPLSNIKFKDLKNKNFKDLDYKIKVNKVKGYEDYDENDDLQGIMYFKLTGKKNAEDVIDWVATIYNIEITEWAVWGELQVYDDFNDNSINYSLWSNTTSGSGHNPLVDEGVSEAGTISCSCSWSYIPDNDCNGIQIDSIALPEYQYLENLTIRAKISLSAGTADCVNTLSQFSLFGQSIVEYTLGTATDDSVWTIYRNFDYPNAFDVYNDGAYNKSINATTDVMQLFVSGQTSGAQCPGSGYARSDYVYYSYANTTLNITLNEPDNNEKFYIDDLITFNVSTNTTLNQLKNITLFINSVQNESQDISGLVNQTIFTKNLTNLGIGTVQWYVQVCDTDTNCKFSRVNSFELQPFQVVTSTANASTYETLTETFSLNVTIDSDNYPFISGTLVYDNKNSTSTTSVSGDNVIFTSSRDITLISGAVESELKDYFWYITITNSSGSSINFNSTTEIQNVSRIHFEQCSATVTTKSVNYTAYDEGSLERVNPFKFQATYDFWLGSGNVKRNISIDNSSATEIDICISPIDRIFKVDSEITYDNVTVGDYVARDYRTQAEQYSNNLINISLYLLKASDSTSFIIFVRDYTLQPVAGALVLIEKYYPGLNDYQVVQIVETDDNGKSVGFYQTETVDYRHTIIKDGEVLLQTSKQKIVAETTPYTLTFTVGEAFINPFSYFENISLLDAELYYNDTLDKVFFVYEDTSGNLTSARLQVYLIKYNSADELICNSSLASSSGVITCDTSLSVNGTYYAQVYVTRSPETFIETITFVKSVVTDVWGYTGLLVGWFIILTVAMTAIWNPVIGVILINASVILINLIGLIHFSLIFIFAMISVSIVLIVYLKS